MHPDAKRKIRAALDVLRADPDLGDALRDELVGMRRLRVGRLSLVYRLRNGDVDVVAVGPRRTIYEDLAARMRRPPGR